MGPEGSHRGDERDPPLVYNWISAIGWVLFAGGLTGFVFFLFLDLAPGRSHAYLALNLIPSISVSLLGALLVALGMIRESRSRKRGRAPSLSGALPQLLSGRRGSLGATLILGSVIVTTAMLSLAMGSVELYELSESNTFCGEACHSVMHPEWTTFQRSPHARLKCVDCHVGPEPESYVAVKLSGLRQLAAVATGSFERPIATPIRSMRPAREVCEQCHWSRRFIDYKEQTRSYFLADEENTALKVRMLTKVGGGEHGFVGGLGIHYHMVVAARVEYMARGPQRQEIPWVRVTTNSGEVREYEDIDDPLSDSERETLEVRTMDCLDCHNRPAHRFRAPVDAVNAALEAGVISRDLPFIKLEAVKALDTGYATQAAALVGISDRLGRFYREEHAEVIEEKFAELQQAIATVQSIYLRTIFPRMKAQWSAYPDNIGHRDSPGCFRCHNDRMESDEGDAMVLECSACHVILAQGADVQRIRTSLDRGEPFFHPGDEDYLEEYTECVDCHSGGADLYE